MKPYEEYQPAAVFEAADNDACIETAYESAGKKYLLPTPNKLIVGAPVADKLYELGVVYGTIDPADVPMPVVSIDLFTDKTPAEINRVLFPERDFRKDFACEKAVAVFVACRDFVVCHLALSGDKDHDTAGDDIGVFRLIDHDSYGIELQVIACDCSTPWLCCTVELENALRWLYRMWLGFQHMLILQPEEISKRILTLPDAMYKDLVDFVDDRAHVVRSVNCYSMKDCTSHTEKEKYSPRHADQKEEQ